MQCPVKTPADLLYTHMHKHISLLSASAYLYCLFVAIESMSAYLYTCMSLSLAFTAQPTGCKFLISAKYTFKLPSLLGKAAASLLLVQTALASPAGRCWGNGLIRFTNGWAFVVFAYLTQSEHTS